MSKKDKRLEKQEAILSILVDKIGNAQDKKNFNNLICDTFYKKLSNHKKGVLVKKLTKIFRKRKERVIK